MKGRTGGCVRKDIRFSLSFSLFPRVTCRTKRNPLRGLCKERLCPIPFPFILPYRYSSALLLPSSFRFSPSSIRFSHSLSLSLSFLPCHPFSRVPDPSPSLLAGRLFLTKDHDEDALARPTGLVARLVLDPVTADVEATTRALRQGKTEKYRRRRQIAVARDDDNGGG